MADTAATPDASTSRAVIDHAGVSVADLEKSERFYRDVLGFTTAEDRFAFPEHDLRGVVLLNPQGARVELFERKGSAPTGPHCCRTLMMSVAASLLMSVCMM
jgi:hypothetical protein